MTNEKDLAKTITNKTIRVWLWLAYKFTENDCRLQLFLEFIQTRNRYPTYLDKISVLTWKQLVISSQNFPCNLNSQITFSLQDISYPSPRLWKYKLVSKGTDGFVLMVVAFASYSMKIDHNKYINIEKVLEYLAKDLAWKVPQSTGKVKVLKTSPESQSFKWIWWNFNSWF